MKIKVYRNMIGKYWCSSVEGYPIGCWKTPSEARQKARMWCMWLNTGDHKYLRMEK